MKKKRGIEIKINFSNRWLYTFIVIGILAFVSVGVYAVAGVSHTSDEIDETDPTVLASVKNGVSWNELSGVPSGFADGVDNTGGGLGSLNDCRTITATFPSCSGAGCADAEWVKCPAGYTLVGIQQEFAMSDPVFVALVYIKKIKCCR